MTLSAWIPLYQSAPRNVAVAYLPGSRSPTVRPVVVILNDPGEAARRARDEWARRVSEGGMP